nr:MAG TPA: Ogr/Delta-like zinc finger protein [Caudoviricetes sp.]
MAAKNSINYRVAIICPACGSAVRVQKSERMSVRTRQYHLLQCTNIACGWTGRGVFEITHTLSLPAKTSAPLPPIAPDAMLDSLLKQ